MPLTDYTAKAQLNWLTGRLSFPALPAVYLALFTAVGSDSGAGFTEVSGGSYARVQVGGTVATNALTATSSAVLTFASVPSWITVGMSVLDETSSGAISGGQTVLSLTSTTVTLTADVNSTVGNGDTIVFSAFAAPSGSGPSQSSNVSTISFPQATANWGTAIAFGMYDALTSGNLIIWDFMGNYPWLPATVTGATPSVFTAHAHGYANDDPIVGTAEYGGTLPTVTAGGPLTSYTVNYAGSVATDSFELTTTAGGGTTMDTSSSGDLFVRKITQQIIANNVTSTFSGGSFTINVA